MALHETFANRVANALHSYPNLISAAVAINLKAKQTKEGFEPSQHADDAEITRNLAEDLLVLGPHKRQLKEQFESISEKIILKKMKEGASTDHDFALLLRKHLLGASYSILALREIEAVEDYRARVQEHKEKREQKETEEFLKREAEIRRQEEEEKERTRRMNLALPNVSFFVMSDNHVEALVDKIHELLLADEVNGTSTASADLTDIVDNIKCFEAGQERLQALFPDIDDTAEIVAALFDLYKRASTTMLD